MRNQCRWRHSLPNLLPSMAPPTETKDFDRRCRYDRKCERIHCKYRHPLRDLESESFSIDFESKNGDVDADIGRIH